MECSKERTVVCHRRSTAAHKQGVVLAPFRLQATQEQNPRLPDHTMKNIFVAILVTALLTHSSIPSIFAFENSYAQPFSPTNTHPNNRDQASLGFDALTKKAYLWGWPLVYLTNIQRSSGLIQRPGVSGGAPVAPINRLSMLTEPVSPDFKSVPCPNPDVIYGFSILDLSQEAVVLQVPDLSDRFWMVQLGDHRTDIWRRMG